MIKSKKQMFIVIGVFALVMLLGTVTYAFFNYTRTGSPNTISVGRISFNHTQDDTINLSNVFPIASTDLGTDVGNHGEVTINVTGDTTYSDGIEYLISFSNVNNTINGKKVPIKYTVTPESLGTEATSYWTQRGGSTSYYHILDTDDIREGKYIAVGYIKSGEDGVDGNLVIKAYVDKDEVAITDTPEENSEWQRGRVILTTEEWNSFTSTPLSFKVKVEANEGIWVRESPTPASCFEINVLSEQDHTAEITNYNGGVTARYIINENLTQEQIDTCVAFFSGMTGGVAEDFEAFCDGTGTYQGVTIQDIFSQSVPDGDFLTPLEESGYLIKVINENPICGVDVEIPKVINGYTVVKIADVTNYSSSFGYKSISKVVIPNSVTTIGDDAFSDNQLTNLVIPNSVTAIGAGAFKNNKLISVIIPNRITTIDVYAFSGNQLTNVVIPNSITTIDAYAFSDNQLTNVVIPNSVTTIGDNAFLSNQLTSVVIPDSVTTVGNGAFTNNKLPNNQEFIYKRTDINHDGIAEIDTTTLVSYGGPNKDVIIPNTITTISSYAFNSCDLTNVVIPNSVTSIGTAAFMMNQLTSVVIPNGVISIAFAAFLNNKLTSVVISNSVTSIGTSAFANNQLTSITIPDNVRSIGESAFSGNKLESVTIGNGITSIGGYAFSKEEYSNSNLSSIAIDKSCSTIKSMSNYSSWIGNNYKTGTTIYGTNSEVCDAF